jgi:RNA polymerase sigma-70 factor (ECF subfamily)
MLEGKPQDPSSDESLMAAYLAGDAQAFDIVYRRHRDGIRRFFARQCGSMAIGQELAQEVWIKLVRAVQDERYTADGRFTTYLYRIARNHLIDWYRKTGSYQEVELDETVGEQAEVVALETQTIRNPEQIYGDQQKIRTVLAAIEELPEVQRTTLMMQLETEMSYEEIAEATGTNRETVKSRLRYARRVLRESVFDET